MAKTRVIQRRHHLSRQRSALTSVAGGRTNTMRRVLVLGAKIRSYCSDLTISGDTLTLTNGLIDTVSRGLLPMVNGLIIRGMNVPAERKTARAEN